MKVEFGSAVSFVEQLKGGGVCFIMDEVPRLELWCGKKRLLEALEDPLARPAKWGSGLDTVRFTPTDVRLYRTDAKADQLVLVMRDKHGNEARVLLMEAEVEEIKNYLRQPHGPDDVLDFGV